MRKRRLRFLEFALNDRVALLREPDANVRQEVLAGFGVKSGEASHEFGQTLHLRFCSVAKAGRDEENKGRQELHFAER